MDLSKQFLLFILTKCDMLWRNITTVRGGLFAAFIFTAVSLMLLTTSRIVGRYGLRVKNFWPERQIDTVETGRASSAITMSSTTERPDNRTLERKLMDEFQDSDVARKFLPKFTAEQQATVKETLRVLVEALDNANISYHMCAGTLLGSYLHHGLIPWDDDVDIFVADRDNRRLYAAVKPHSRDYALITSTNQPRWKFFSRKHAKPTRPEKPWNSPFIDVIFYAEDGSTIWDLAMGKPEENAKRFPKSMVFPLRRRPFMNLTLSAPNNSTAYLLHNYSLQNCTSNWYNHVNETEVKGPLTTIPCSRLWNVYPFVFRTKLNNGTVETLKIGSKVIGSLFVDKFDAL